MCFIVCVEGVPCVGLLCGLFRGYLFIDGVLCGGVRRGSGHPGSGVHCVLNFVVFLSLCCLCGGSFVRCMWSALITCCARVQRIDFAGSVSLIGRSTVRCSVGFRGAFPLGGLVWFGRVGVWLCVKSFIARIGCRWFGLVMRLRGFRCAGVCIAWLFELSACMVVRFGAAAGSPRGLFRCDCASVVVVRCAGFS